MLNILRFWDLEESVMKNSGKITEKQLLSFEIMQDLSLRDHSLKSEKLETILSLDFSLRANKGGISLKYSAFWNYYLKKKERKKIYIVILKQNITCDFEIGILLYRLSLTCSKISEKNAPDKTAFFVQLQNIPELI